MQQQTNETSKNTVTKLVATNLIANGKVEEGVQLLCTIDLCAEACRYLQDHNQWERSIWLAKLRLKPNSNEYIDVIKRWSEYIRLYSQTSKLNSVLILISAGQFRRAIEILHNQGATELAIRLFVCCKQFGIDDGTIGQKLFDDYIDSLFEKFNGLNHSTLSLACCLCGNDYIKGDIIEPIFNHIISTVEKSKGNQIKKN